MQEEIEQERTKIIASIDGQTITIHESDVTTMTIYLNDTMMELDKSIIGKYKDRELGSFDVVRSQQTILETMRDSKDYYTSELRIVLP